MPFTAYVATRDDGDVRTAVGSLDERALPDGGVTVRVEWSAVNFKDAMVTVPGNRVARVSPLIPGVDLAGTVESSDDPDLPPGMPVLAHGYDIGVSRHGGFATLARLPAQWVVPLPPGLDARHAMIFGTAGFTALLSLTSSNEPELRPSAARCW